MKWEYRFEAGVGENLEYFFNKLGADGWELILRYEGGFIFKRQIEKWKTV